MFALQAPAFNDTRLKAAPAHCPRGAYRTEISVASTPKQTQSLLHAPECMEGEGLGGGVNSSPPVLVIKQSLVNFEAFAVVLPEVGHNSVAEFLYLLFALFYVFVFNFTCGHNLPE